MGAVATVIRYSAAFITCEYGQQWFCVMRLQHRLQSALVPLMLSQKLLLTLARSLHGAYLSCSIYSTAISIHFSHGMSTTRDSEYHECIYQYLSRRTSYFRPVRWKAQKGS